MIASRELRPLAVCFVIGCALAAGCQKTSDLVDVVGNVTWKGQPMPSGMVVFKPDDAHQAPIGGKINDGKFALKTKPGKMKVHIEAVRATQNRDPQTGAFLGEMYVPNRYNRETTLEANVTREGKNTFDFPLKE
jgi:hypothetical protein